MSKPWTMTVSILVSASIFVAASGVRTDEVAQPSRPDVKRIPARNVPTTREFREGEVLVRYKESAIKTTVPSERAEVLKTLGDRLHSELGVVVLSTAPILGIQRLKVAPGETVETTISKLKQDSAVEVAEPNYKAYIATPQPQPPDDPEWLSGELWGMVKIGMRQAWRKSVPNEIKMVIAIIDTGITYSHHDLQPNIWKNTKELNGTPNIDDDGNNIVDDIHGADFCNRTPPTPSSPEGDPTGDPIDDYGHGTLMAGTIGAVGNNGKYVAGVTWRARLMSLKAFCSNGEGWVGDIEDAIDYALSKGANIINASWTVSGSLGTLESTIRTANRFNVLFVAAAGNSAGGNDNDSNPVYPASFQLDNVMAVGATTRDDQLWVKSHWGVRSVHIAAPGVYILSTLDDDIGEGEGTSSAAAHVTGCAALVQAKRLASTPPSPLLSPKDLRTLLIKEGDRVPGLVGKIFRGRRLNCGKAATR